METGTHRISGRDDAATNDQALPSQADDGSSGAARRKSKPFPIYPIAFQYTKKIRMQPQAFPVSFRTISIP